MSKNQNLLRKVAASFARWGALFIALLIMAMVWDYATIDELPNVKANDTLRITVMNIQAHNIIGNIMEERLLASNPNIVIVVEWTGQNVNMVKFTSAGYNLVLNQPAAGTHGLLIMSKLNGHATMIPSPVQTPCPLPVAFYSFNWGGVSTSLVALHAPPPIAACNGTTQAYLLAVAEWFDNGRLKAEAPFGRAEDRVIVVGDFNTISWDRAMYAMRAKKLTDVFEGSGLLNTTWGPSKYALPLARIDYILFSKELQAKKRYRFHVPGSDHLGLMADLAFTVK